MNTNLSNITKIKVSTSRESYPIVIGRGLEAFLVRQIGELKASGAQVAAITDERVRTSLSGWFERAFAGLPSLSVPPGEKSKSIEQFARILDFFAQEQLDRGGVAIAVGGGVIGDLTGYAAASWLRGIRFIQVPTTLLSMVDSSVGGKTGINIEAGKNLVGAFHQPIAVYADLEALSTLPSRDFAAGMAEVMKYGMLGDLELFEMLESKPLLDWRDERLAAVVQRNCQLKADVVNADEKELSKSDGRALLNLGHTFGHAIENVAGYGEYLHGEAIAIGFVAAAKLSESCGYIGGSDTERIVKMIRAHGLPVKLRDALPVRELMAAMRKDKKTRAGQLRFVVLRQIGQAATKDDISLEVVKNIWKELGASV